VDRLGTKRTARKRRRIAAIGASAIIAAAFASAADARLVYERISRTSHPTIWVARDDGSDARRLASGSSPKISPDGRLVAYTGGQGLMLVPAQTEDFRTGVDRTFRGEQQPGQVQTVR
jgi:Tol biopolymer transport system component